MVIARGADMRYVGQEHSVTVDLTPDLFANQDRAGIKSRFDAVHDLRYGTCAPQERSEIVSLRVTVTGMLEKPTLEIIEQGDAAPVAYANNGTRPVRFGADLHDTVTWGPWPAARGQCHQGSGPDRGACLDDGAPPRRHAGGRRVR